MYYLIKAVQKCQAYIRLQFETTHQPHLCFHHLEHTIAVVENVKTLSHDLNIEHQLLLQMSAWMHDIGYLSSYQQHEDKSIDIAQTFFKDQISVAQIRCISACIQATKIDIIPTNNLEAILKDADSCYGIGPYFETRGNALRKEWQLMLGKEYSDTEWTTVQIHFLQNLKLYSMEAQHKYTDDIQQNLKNLVQ